jgi:hypothetical protein
MVNIDSIIDEMQNLKNMNICDAECEKKKAIKNHADELQKSINDYNNAKNNIIKHQAKYIRGIKGDSEYIKHIQNRNMAEAEGIIENKQKKKNASLNEIESKLKYYLSIDKFRESVGYKLNNYDVEINNMVREKNKTTKQQNINNRLSHFYNEKMNYLSNVNSIFFYIYYVFLSIILLITVYKKQYSNLKLLGYILTLGLLPLLIDDIYYHILKGLKHSVVDNIYIILFSLFVVFTLVVNKFANNIFPDTID